MTNKRYVVTQGVLTKSGEGDMPAIRDFDNLEQAQEFFNRIKEDTNGYWINRRVEQRLCTELLDYGSDDYDVYDLPESIDYYEF